MSQPAHAERGHALLGASKAEQWLNCPPSARAQEHVPDQRSEFADEGTAAHELSEIKLRSRLFPANSKIRRQLTEAYELFKDNVEYFNAEMEEATDRYVEVVEEAFLGAKAKTEDALFLLEEHLDFSDYVPEGYGTGDVVIIADGVLEVIDLKYGKGVPVSAIDNPQIRLYALGAYLGYEYLYDIQEVRMTIVQPRLDSVSTDVLPIGDLLEWAETIVKPAAELAFDGKGEFKAGDHCRWCKIKGSCRARADQNMKALEHEFQDPAQLSLEEIGQVLHVAEQLKAWAKDVEEYAFEQAKNGEKVPGWKLVEGRSTRRIADDEALLEALEKEGFPADSITETKLLGISKLEKIVKKKQLESIAGDLIIKPPGKPTLVPETDRRPAMNSIEDDFEGEGFEV